VIGTRIINELKVLATQITASDFVGLYDEENNLLGAVSKKVLNDLDEQQKNEYMLGVRVSEEPLTFEELKHSLTQTYFAWV
jgi:hypothetical protein